VGHTQRNISSLVNAYEVAPGSIAESSFFTFLFSDMCSNTDGDVTCADKVALGKCESDNFNMETKCNLACGLCGMYILI
jgi:hypothetical protein